MRVMIDMHAGSRASGIMDDGCEEKYLLIIASGL
jgi:hypothetical protein